MTYRRRMATFTAAATGVGVILTAGIVAAPAMAAEPFTPEELSYSYPSNAAYDYVPILDAFTGLVESKPVIIALNDSKTVAINSAATPLEVERAIVDQYADMSLSMSDGMGANLGAIYLDAMQTGGLPKTQALVTKAGGLIGYYSSTNPAKEFFDYDRPYIRFGEDLTYRDKEGGDAWGSTSGAFPSGHTSQAYWQGTALATILPELAPQILARTSEAGHNRIIMAAHYPLDVMGGRMMGQHIVERRWSDPEFRVLLEAASAELRGVLEAGCGAALAECIASDTPYLSDDAAVAVYTERMSYGFPQIGAAGEPVSLPANAESLLISSHPELNDAQRRQVLELTSIDSGYPLDKGTAGSWQRLNLAAAMDAEVIVNADGTVSLVNAPVTPPVEPPVVEPVEPPVVEPVEPPVVPVTPPVVAPVTPPVVAPVAPPVAPPVVAPVAGTVAAVPTADARGKAHTSATLATTGASFGPEVLIGAFAMLMLGTGLMLRRRRGSRV